MSPPASPTSWGSPPTYPVPPIGVIPTEHEPTTPDPEPTGDHQHDGPAVITKQRVVRSPKKNVGMVAFVVLVLAVGIAVGLVLGRRPDDNKSVRASGPSADAAATGSGASSRTAIEEAATSCGVGGKVGDDGTSISFDTEGKDDFFGDSIDDVICVLEGLDIPDRVRSRIDQTRALDGTQDAAWDDYEAFWNYHPKSGLNITVYIPG